jgi:site-specific DNA-methyltransferase (adenine-specific)
MSMDHYVGTRQPDILEVIANLSNSEVFTPPRIANDVLDLLPEHVWNDPTLRWLDPASKTGVFPREITRRLMVGLADVMPDESTRLRHILRHMIHAIAITNMTGMMSRRSLYCSTDASSLHSVTKMASPDGNVWHGRTEHRFDNRGKCEECGGASTQLEVAGRDDNYAYAFIHSRGKAQLAEAIDMRFDVIVGNPPYQMDAADGNRTIPIYNLFVEEAKRLNPRYLLFITPSRWMAGGLGLNEYRASMLSDARIRKLVDFPDASDVFPGVEIKGGVCYFLWDRDNSGTCESTLRRGTDVVGPTVRDLGAHDVFVRDARALTVLERVRERHEPSITEMLAADKEFGMTSNWPDFRVKARPTDVAFHYNVKGSRRVGGMARKSVPKSAHLIDSWKVLVPQAGSDGGQKIPDVVLGTMMVVEPPSVCTQTYLFFYCTTREQAESIHSYVRTRFVRFLVSLRKMTQHATRSTYTWVPQQTWDRTWTDVELYQKYGITKEEQAYIESMVKEMPA